MPEENKERDEKEYLALLAIFQHFADNEVSEEDYLEVVGELMELRASHLIGRALDGFSLTLDEALTILRSKDGLSDLDIARRDIVIAAIENLIDFAIAEEYQMLLELSDIDEYDEEPLEDDAFAIFDKYNKRYAFVENKDAEYAMIVAAGLVSTKPTTILTYMTQGDERVRPWHLQYEGVSAPKATFPAWLIPPIEHMCRCYLVEDTVENSVKAANNKNLQMPDWFNPTFKESVALGGRIFSDEHPYFQIMPEHNDMLQVIAKKIKSKYFNIDG